MYCIRVQACNQMTPVDAFNNRVMCALPCVHTFNLKLDPRPYLPCRLASVCQLGTVALLGARFAAHLPFAMLLQTLAFVALNKVRLPSCHVA